LALQSGDPAVEKPACEVALAVECARAAQIDVDTI
jgi:hypothetical protein